MPAPIDTKQIRIDLGTQSRIALNDDVVKEYAEAMASGTVFPPILVFIVAPNDEHILVDGFHRFAAHMQVKPNDQIQAELRIGTIDDAKWESVASNKSHGLRRTNEDKRNAVRIALLLPKGAELSDRQIANHVGVHHDTVGRIRSELELTGEIRQSKIRTGRDGRTINTGGIGFGRRIPPDATCATCRYFKDNHCHSNQTEPLPWTEACDEFEPKWESPPIPDVPPPDYDNIVVYTEDKDKTSNNRVHQNRNLKDSEMIYLSKSNAQLFAVELRNRFNKEYLISCLAALRQILMDEND